MKFLHLPDKCLVKHIEAFNFSTAPRRSTGPCKEKIAQTRSMDEIRGERRM